jgi:hypothetical protein
LLALGHDTFVLLDDGLLDLSLWNVVFLFRLGICIVIIEDIIIITLILSRTFRVVRHLTRPYATWFGLHLLLESAFEL